jgi:hypothetical protein
MSDNDALDFYAAYAAAAEAVGQIKPPEELTPHEKDQFWVAAAGCLEWNAMTARKKLAAEIGTE